MSGTLLAIGGMTLAACALAAFRKRHEIEDWIFEWRENRRHRHDALIPEESSRRGRRPFLAPGHPATQAPLDCPPNPMTATELLRAGDHVRAGQMFMALRQYDAAISAFRMAATRDAHFYIEVARIAFLKGDLDEGLKACFASEDFVAIAHGCRHAEAWGRLVDHLLTAPLGEADLRRLGHDFWLDLMESTSSDKEKSRAWMERVATLGGDSQGARLARMHLDGETLPERKAASQTSKPPLSHVG